MAVQLRLCALSLARSLHFGIWVRESSSFGSLLGAIVVSIRGLYVGYCKSRVFDEGLYNKSDGFIEGQCMVPAVAL